MSQCNQCSLTAFVGGSPTHDPRHDDGSGRLVPLDGGALERGRADLALLEQDVDVGGPMNLHGHVAAVAVMRPSRTLSVVLRT